MSAIGEFRFSHPSISLRWAGATHAGMRRTVEEFDVHVVHVEKVVDHRRRSLGVLAFACGVKRQAFTRVGATGDEMVEERNVTACGDFVE